MPFRHLTEVIMSTGAIIGIVIAVIVVVAVVVVASAEMRRARLRRQFGPEYDRLAEKLGSKRKADAELTERGRSLEDVIAAETDKLTERALATFGPAEREAVIRALAAIRRNLTGP